MPTEFSDSEFQLFQSYIDRSADFFSDLHQSFPPNKSKFQAVLNELSQIKRVLEGKYSLPGPVLGDLKRLSIVLTDYAQHCPDDAVWMKAMSHKLEIFLGSVLLDEPPELRDAEFTYSI